MSANAARRQVQRALAAGLAPVKLSTRDHGFNDALRGVRWSCPDDEDLLDYSLGYAEGEIERCMILADHRSATTERSQ